MDVHRLMGATYADRSWRSSENDAERAARDAPGAIVVGFDLIDGPCRDRRSYGLALGGDGCDGRDGRVGGDTSSHVTDRRGGVMDRVTFPIWAILQSWRGLSRCHGPEGGAVHYFFGAVSPSVE